MANKTAAAAGPAVDTLSFEEALTELEKIVRQLESGAGDLAASIGSYERGVALKKHCEARLKEAQMKIEKITVSADGKVSTAPFSAE
jgi:exodeoxyribonuclease VII small subunit